jgi:transcription antitermination factor NusG
MMRMVKIRYIREFPGVTDDIGITDTGDIVEVSEELANRLVQGAYFELVEERNQPMREEPKIEKPKKEK